MQSNNRNCVNIVNRLLTYCCCKQYNVRNKKNLYCFTTLNVKYFLTLYVTG